MSLILKSALAGFLGLGLAGCIQTQLTSFDAAQDTAKSYDNIGQVVLELEGAIPGRSDARNILDELVANAIQDVENSGALDEPDEPQRARTTLRAIAASLRSNGFRHTYSYPDTLTEALLSETKSFDCDTGSLIFLSVAEELDLPLSMVEVEAPGYSPTRAFGDHNFVRWTLTNGDRIDWDPNDEDFRSGDAETDLYGFAWTREELLGYAHYLRGIHWEKIDELDRAIADYERSIDLFPRYPKPKNNLAWIFSSRRELAGDNRSAEALALALEVVSLHPTTNNKDTLACAYALNDRFDEALRLQEEVVFEDPEEPAFQESLRKIRAGQKCY